jgi:hypothetical protein
MAGIRVTDKQLTKTGLINLGTNVPDLFYVRNMFFAQSEAFRCSSSNFTAPSSPSAILPSAMFDELAAGR